MATFSLIDRFHLYSRFYSDRIPSYPHLHSLTFIRIDEMDRIRKAGGFVEFGRVNGNLALSRAFGDLEYKNNGKLSAEEQAVTGMCALWFYLILLFC